MSTLCPEGQGLRGDREDRVCLPGAPSSLPLCMPAYGQDPEDPVGTAQRLGAVPSWAMGTWGHWPAKGTAGI